ncbi:MAG: hypothetical protein IJ233_04555 [Pyramidobacter sp.]|nr:hypothetical protein [Pyramidobacter sp.]
MMAKTSRFTEYIDAAGRRFRVGMYGKMITKDNGLLKTVQKPKIMEFCGRWWELSAEVVAGRPVNDREFKNRTEAQKTLDLLAKARGWAKYEEADA